MSLHMTPCQGSAPPAEGGFPCWRPLPLSVVEDWSEFAREEQSEVSTVCFELILAGYASLVTVQSLASFAWQVSPCKTEQATFSLFIENDSEQQIKILAVLVRPETPNFVFLGEGTFKVDCHVTGEDLRLSDFSRIDPLWELKDVLRLFVIC